MNQAIKEYNLDITPGSGNKLILRTSQYDTRYRKYKIYLYLDEEKYYIPDGSNVYYRGRKPDKTIFEKACEWKDNYVIIELLLQMTNAWGDVDSEIAIVGANGGILYTGNILLEVERSPFSKDILVTGNDLELIAKAAQNAERAQEIIDVKDALLHSKYDVVFFANGTTTGTSALLVGEKNILIDLGTSQCSNLIKDYLITNNINVDYLIISHFHSDHIGENDGLESLLNTGKFDNVLALLPHKDINYNQCANPNSYINNKDMVERLLSQKGITFEYPENYQKFIINNATYFVVGNIGDYDDYYNVTYQDITNFNNFSMIVNFNHFNNCFAFTGDIENEAQLKCKDFFINTTVYTIPHHSINRDSQFELLNVIHPQYAVIQARTDYPHRTNAINQFKSIGTPIVDNKVNNRNIIFTSSLLGVLLNEGYKTIDDVPICNYNSQEMYKTVADLDEITDLGLVVYNASTLNTPDGMSYGMCVTYKSWGSTVNSQWITQVCYESTNNHNYITAYRNYVAGEWGSWIVNRWQKYNLNFADDVQVVEDGTYINNLEKLLYVSLRIKTSSSITNITNTDERLNFGSSRILSCIKNGVGVMVWCRADGQIRTSSTETNVEYIINGMIPIL